MKSIVLSLFVILIHSNMLAGEKNDVIKSFSTSYGYSLNNQLLVDFQLGYNDLIFKLNSSICVDQGTKGNLNNNIGWNEFPEHIISEGTYFSSVDFGLGFYFFDNVFIIGYLGLGFETSYRNSYDESHAAYDEDNYHLINNDSIGLHMMGEFGYVWHILSLSIVYSEETDVGFKLGLFWDGDF